MPIYTELPRPQCLVGCILLNHRCIKPICSSCPLLTTQLQLNLSEVGHYSLTIRLENHVSFFFCIFLSLASDERSADWLAILEPVVQTITYSMMTNARNIIVICISLLETYLINTGTYADWWKQWQQWLGEGWYLLRAAHGSNIPWRAVCPWVKT